MGDCRVKGGGANWFGSFDLQTNAVIRLNHINMTPLGQTGLSVPLKNAKNISPTPPIFTWSSYKKQDWDNTSDQTPQTAIPVALQFNADTARPLSGVTEH